MDQASNLGVLTWVSKPLDRKVEPNMALMTASTGPPSVKFDVIDDGIIGAVVDIETVPLTDFKTNEVVYYDRGPKMGQMKEQEKITVVALRPEGGATKGKDHEPIVQGDLLTIWSSGMKRKAFFDELNRVGAVNEGDLIRYVHNEEDDSGTGKYALKLFKVSIRPPKADDPNEMAVSNAAIEESKARKHQTALATGDTAAVEEYEVDF